MFHFCRFSGIKKVKYPTIIFTNNWSACIDTIVWKLNWAGQWHHYFLQRAVGLDKGTN